MRRDERSLDEIRRVQMRWDDVWSVESEVWSVKRAVSSATFETQSVAWRCIATWICAGHDRWRRQRGSFAKKTHTHEPGRRSALGRDLGSDHAVKENTIESKAKNVILWDLMCLKMLENPIESCYIQICMMCFLLEVPSLLNLKHWASAQVISGQDNEVVLNHFFSEDWGIKDFQYSHVFLQPDMPMFKSAHAAEWTGSRTCCVLGRT